MEHVSRMARASGIYQVRMSAKMRSTYYCSHFKWNSAESFKVEAPDTPLEKRHRREERKFFGK